MDDPTAGHVLAYAELLDINGDETTEDIDVGNQIVIQANTCIIGQN